MIFQWPRTASAAHIVPNPSVLGAAFLLALSAPAAARPSQDGPLSDVAASRIAVISDGDFLASTYADAMLAPYRLHRDLLTLLTFRDGRITRTSIEVSNSVTAAPEVLAAAPDGRTFYVVDRLARATPAARRTPDLSPGRTLTAIRADDHGVLSILATQAVPASSEALAVSPDGAWLAIVGNEETRSTLTLVPLQDGAPGEPIVLDAVTLGLAGYGEGPRGGIMLTNVQWRPDGRALAINDTGGGRVGFFHVEDGPRPRVTAWGAPVASGKDPFVGRFSPGGRFYLTSEWGRDLAATALDQRIPQTAGKLGVIRLEADGEHQRLGGVKTGLSPEGIAISPDGRLIATVNMRGTAFPPVSPRFTREASVTLLAFDPTTGAAHALSETPFEGALPEGASFDASGRHLLVTVFEGHAGSLKQAGLEVFRVERDGAEPRLRPLGRIAAPHGAHHVVVH